MDNHIFMFNQVDEKYGLPQSSVQDLAACLKNNNLLQMGTNLILNSEIRKKIEKHQKENKRCFLFVYIVPDASNQLTVGAGEIISLENIHKLDFVSADKRFVEYVTKYDIEIMLPIYIKSVGNKFIATLVALPWGDKEKIKKALKLDS